MRKADLREVRRNEGGMRSEGNVGEVRTGKSRRGRCWVREGKRRLSVGRTNRGEEGN